MEILNKDGFRADGRKIDEMRRLKISFKTINNKPVIEYSQGLTQLRTTVIGPKSGNKRDKIQPIIKFNSFAKQETGYYEHYKDEYEGNIIKIFNNVILLEAPFFVEIFVDIIQDNGSVLSAIINSISLIIAYSGIPIKDVVLSLTNGFYDAKIFCDITTNEENNRIPAFVLAYLPKKQKFVGIVSKGHIHQNNFNYVFSQSILYIQKLYSVISDFLKNIHKSEEIIYFDIK
ncbi:putative exosome complex component RRP41 [Dictyocoela muelleri]|nr:putative exosome complex component RRP41 [Dictyocoela muelleri]